MGFVEKPSDHAVAPALVNAGIYVVDRALILELVPPGAESDFGHDVFPAALAMNRRLAAHFLTKPVLDVGTPKTLEAARELDHP